MALEWLEDGVRRIVAPNPSALTFRGTCSYVLGTGRVAVIDPGPDDPAHLQAILAGLAPGEEVAAILVTHAHLDHSAAARPFAALTGAPVYGFGDALAGRTEAMAQLAATGLAGGGEGVDAGFCPDVTLANGAVLSLGDWEVEALHTPGHFGNHLSFRMGRAVFSGDLVMGWATTLISPPDGDLAAYFRSLDRLGAVGAQVFYPGHGDPIAAPSERLAQLAAHRQARTDQILAALAEAPSTLAALTARVYADTPPALHAAAARNLFAHLIALVETGRAEALPELSSSAIYQCRED